MPVRRAEAQWEGSLRDGTGTMAFGSGAFEGRYSFASRFEEGEGTNPDELIGAAEAGCFSMALSGDLGRAGYSPTRVRTTAEVHVDKVEGGFAISRIDLRTEAEVPGIDDAEFQQVAETTRTTCPVSKALTGTELTLEAKLV